jgi:hypothetical protein
MTPVVAPCARANSAPANNPIPINMIIDARANVLFFKKYTQTFGMLKKAVCLSFSTVFLLKDPILPSRKPRAHRVMPRIAGSSI